MTKKFRPGLFFLRPFFQRNLKNSQSDSVTKAKALTDLQKNGQVDTVILKKYMVGDQPQSKPIVPATSKSETLKEDRPDMLKVLDRIKK